MKFLFIDFEDSFSFNILSEIRIHLNLEKSAIDFIHYEELRHFSSHKINSYHYLILGPGPGHPEEYIQELNLARIFECKKVRFFGVCLGHQILLKLKGFSITKSVKALHGERVSLELNLFWKNVLKINLQKVFVQRYNSLAVKFDNQISPDRLLLEGNEIMAYLDERIISYQFHPESVGTDFRKHFFSDALKNHMEVKCESL